MNFEQVIYSDLYEIKRFQPNGWPDIVPAFKFYIDSEFCMPIKALINNKIAGIGACIFYKNTAWLAHIIVAPENRNKGIGLQIVKKLIKFKEFKKLNTISLIATEMGMPVYLKAGFRELSDYVVYKREKAWVKQAKSAKVIQYNSKYHRMVFDLDNKIIGEDRSLLLEEHLPESLIYLDNNKIAGFYMPSLGEGPIIADTAEAGIELMKIKYSKADRVAFPSENKTAIEFLEQNGFLKANYFAKKMILGDDINWFPEKIYNRIGGNFG